jgi:hypothetical protein
MMDGFGKSRQQFDRSFRRMNILVWSIIGLSFVSIPAIGYVAYRAGCLQSMILNGVCLSDPTIDGALKRVFGK